MGALLGLIPALLASEAAAPAATNLKPATVSAFDEYVKLTQARNDSELQRGTNLLWVDTLPEGLTYTKWLGGIDFGTRNPFAAVWGFFDPFAVQASSCISPTTVGN